MSNKPKAKSKKTAKKPAKKDLSFGFQIDLEGDEVQAPIEQPQYQQKKQAVIMPISNWNVEQEQQKQLQQQSSKEKHEQQKKLKKQKEDEELKRIQLEQDIRIQQQRRNESLQKIKQSVQVQKQYIKEEGLEVEIKEPQFKIKQEEYLSKQQIIQEIKQPQSVTVVLEQINENIQAEENVIMKQEKIEQIKESCFRNQKTTNNFISIKPENQDLQISLIDQNNSIEKQKFQPITLAKQAMIQESEPQEKKVSQKSIKTEKKPIKKKSTKKIATTKTSSISLNMTLQQQEVQQNTIVPVEKVEINQQKYKQCEKEQFQHPEPQKQMQDQHIKVQQVHVKIEQNRQIIIPEDQILQIQKEKQSQEQKQSQELFKKQDQLKIEFQNLNPKIITNKQKATKKGKKKIEKKQVNKISLQIQQEEDYPQHQLPENIQLSQPKSSDEIIHEQSKQKDVQITQQNKGNNQSEFLAIDSLKLQKSNEDQQSMQPESEVNVQLTQEKSYKKQIQTQQIQEENIHVSISMNQKIKKKPKKQVKKPKQKTILIQQGFNLLQQENFEEQQKPQNIKKGEDFKQIQQTCEQISKQEDFQKVQIKQIQVNNKQTKENIHNQDISESEVKNQNTNKELFPIQKLEIPQYKSPVYQEEEKPEVIQQQIQQQITITVKTKKQPKSKTKKIKSKSKPPKAKIEKLIFDQKIEIDEQSSEINKNINQQEIQPELSKSQSNSASSTSVKAQFQVDIQDQTKEKEEEISNLSQNSENIQQTIEIKDYIEKKAQQANKQTQEQEIIFENYTLFSKPQNKEKKPNKKKIQKRSGKQNKIVVLPIEENQLQTELIKQPQQQIVKKEQENNQQKQNNIFEKQEQKQQTEKIKMINTQDLNQPEIIEGSNLQESEHCEKSQIVKQSQNLSIDQQESIQELSFSFKNKKNIKKPNQTKKKVKKQVKTITLSSQSNSFSFEKSEVESPKKIENKKLPSQIITSLPKETIKQIQKINNDSISEKIHRNPSAFKKEKIPLQNAQSNQIIKEIVSMIKFHNDEQIKLMRQRIKLLEEDVRSRLVRQEKNNQHKRKYVEKQEKYDEIIEENIDLRQHLGMTESKFGIDNQ